MSRKGLVRVPCLSDAATRALRGNDKPMERLEKKQKAILRSFYDRLMSGRADAIYKISKFPGNKIARPGRYLVLATRSSRHDGVQVSYFYQKKAGDGGYQPWYATRHADIISRDDILGQDAAMPSGVYTLERF